jgi:hypothetical protein
MARLAIQFSKLKTARTILITGLTAGTLDAVAAVILYAKPINLHNIGGIFRFIASGLFGRTAYSDGLSYPIAGLTLHFLIAIFWSSVYLLILFRSFKSGFVLIKIILFSGLVWIVMNGLVLPFCGLTSKHHSDWMILKSLSPILLCVGLPICLIVEKRSAAP